MGLHMFPIPIPPRLPSWDTSLSLTLLSLFLYFIFCPTSFQRLGCFSGCVMSSASDQKLFYGVCSAFKWSFHEFVGEKVVSPSYSSTMLTPSLWGLNFKTPPGKPSLGRGKPRTKIGKPLNNPWRSMCSVSSTEIRCHPCHPLFEENDCSMASWMGTSTYGIPKRCPKVISMLEKINLNS